MKQTVYFTGKTRAHNELDIGIEAAITKRDEFLADSSNNVAKIDREEIQFIVITNNSVLPVISLTYYPKE